MRFIPRIDIKSDYMIKSIRYDGLRNLGQPEVFAKKYYEDGKNNGIGTRTFLYSITR
jgi:cyclase